MRCNWFLITLLFSLCVGLRASGQGTLPLELVEDVPLSGGAFRFDYQSLDSEGGRLYIAHLGATTFKWTFINRKLEVLYYYGPTARYLDQPTGLPSQDLIVLAREGLRSKLRAVIHTAIREQRRVRINDVRIKRNGTYSAVYVAATPVAASQVPEGLLLVTFSDVQETAAIERHGSFVGLDARFKIPRSTSVLAFVHQVIEFLNIDLVGKLRAELIVTLAVEYEVLL